MLFDMYSLRCVVNRKTFHVFSRYWLDARGTEVGGGQGFLYLNWRTHESMSCVFRDVDSVSWIEVLKCLFHVFSRILIRFLELNCKKLKLSFRVFWEIGSFSWVVNLTMSIARFPRYWFHIHDFKEFMRTISMDYRHASFSCCFCVVCSFYHFSCCLFV